VPSATPITKYSPIAKLNAQPSGRAARHGALVLSENQRLARQPAIHVHPAYRVPAVATVTTDHTP
jgi:hypothetical protein